MRAQDNIIILLIVLVSVMMGFESCELDQTSELALLAGYIDLICLGVFVTEMIAKILSSGLAFSPHAYLASGWNRLDGLIVVTSLISVHASPAVRTLRILRVLRPLRLISHFEGMRTAVQHSSTR